MRLSIVIATHNRRDLLRRCLESIDEEKRACAGLVEVIVVEDGCSDGTGVMLENEFPWVVRVSFSTNVGAARALNAGAGSVQGDVLLFLDDDMECQHGVFDAHMRFHRSCSAEVAIGHFPLGSRPRRSFFRHVVYEWTEDWQASFGEDVSFFDALCSGHFSIRREVWQQAGGFDASFDRWGRKDSELGFRLLQAGYRFGNCVRAEATQRYSKSPSKLLEDFRSLGHADVKLARKHPPLVSSLLLSRYHQAPCLIRLLREGVRRHSSLAESLRKVVVRVFDPLSKVPVDVQAARSAFWTTADVCYWQGVKSALGGGEGLTKFVGGAVPILLYHRIGASEDPSSVSLRRFAKHMRWLYQAGYRVLPLRDVVTSILEGRALPAKAVVVTFDDAYRDVWQVLEVVEAYQFPITLFVPTAYVGRAKEWRCEHGQGAPLLSSDELRKLQSRGVDLQSHGHMHTSMGGLSETEIEDDLAASREVLRELGARAEYVAYPNGSYSREAQSVVDGSDFRAAFTTESHLASLHSDVTAIPRITIGDFSRRAFSFAIRQGIPPSLALKELPVHLREFRPARYWHRAPAFDENKIYSYIYRRPSGSESFLA